MTHDPILVPEPGDEDLVDELLDQSEPTEEELIAAARLTRDLKKSATLLNMKQAKYLIRLYYNLQNLRIRASAQIRAFQEEDEPNMLISWTKDMYAALEGDIGLALKSYAASTTPGTWALSQKGIGPVIAAGLQAYVDIERGSTAGALWRYAGYDPTIRWLGADKAKKIISKAVKEVGTHEVTDELILAISRESGWPAKLVAKIATDEEDGTLSMAALATNLPKRPWNAKLKTLCWKAGQSFVKVSGRDSFYGTLYKERKLYEMEKNTNKEYDKQAERALQEKNYGTDTEAYKWYTLGMLPPAHIQARVERYAVKMFLSHYQQVAFESHYGTKAPAPYAIEHLGHVDLLAPPNWPMDTTK